MLIYYSNSLKINDAQNFCFNIMYKFGQQILKNDRIKLAYFNINQTEMIYV